MNNRIARGALLIILFLSIFAMQYWFRDIPFGPRVAIGFLGSYAMLIVLNTYFPASPNNTPTNNTPRFT